MGVINHSKAHLELGAYHLRLRNNIDVVIQILKPKWHEQFGNILLRVAAIIIPWQFSYEQQLLAFYNILENVKKIKREGINKAVK